MSQLSFFSQPEQQQIVKTKIVAKYFGAWTKVMLPRAKGGPIAYVDLFSGPGKFEDGKPSTPLWILSHAIKDDVLRNRLVTRFNDSNPSFAAQLQGNINQIPQIDTLRYAPLVGCDEVGDEFVRSLEGLSLVPTLFFIDPWGYKGLGIDLIGNAIRSWGCDCIFFFNYNRVNPGLTNPSVADHMNRLFGRSRADALRSKLPQLQGRARRTLILGELQAALKSVGGKYTIPFEFQSSHGERTSHYIVFVSKSHRGYMIMKDIMSGMSTDPEEVPEFVYHASTPAQLRLGIDPDHPYSIPALKDYLMKVCAGTTATVGDIIADHNVDTPYVSKHFKEALKQLEAAGLVSTVPTAVDRRKDTMADGVRVTFPS